jgi:hypothetical protein
MAKKRNVSLLGKRHKPKKPKRKVGKAHSGLAASSQKLPLPHGTVPYHFRHGGVEGNGFNGQIRHLWQPPPKTHTIPGLGNVTPR